MSGKDNELLTETFRVLAGLQSPLPLDDTFAVRLTAALRKCKVLVESGADLMIDLLGAHDTWRVAASTNQETPVGIPHSAQYGLVGWALRHARMSSVLIADNRSMPADVQMAEGFADVRAAFVHLLKHNQVPVACLCATATRIPNGLVRIAPLLDNVAKVIEIAAAGGTRYALWAPSQIRIPTANTNEQFSDWISLQLSNLAPGPLVYWRLDPHYQNLDPIPVPRDSREAWLKPLQLGNGFAGFAAKNLKSIRDEVSDGVGLSSGIKTPLPDISPGQPIRCIIAVPVHDENRCYGAMTALGDSPGQFDLADMEALESVASQLAIQLHARDTRSIVATRKQAFAKIHEALHGPDSPHAYWERVSCVFDLLRDAGFFQSAYFFVAKQFDRFQYVRKAQSSGSISLLAGPFDVRREAWFRAASRETDGVLTVQRLRLPELTTALGRLDVGSLRTDHYPRSESPDDLPTFVVIAALPNQSLYSHPFGKRDLSEEIDSVVSAVFYNGRAILTAANLASSSEQQSLMVSSELHDLRSPLVSLRHTAEALDNLDAAQTEQRAAILNQADNLLARVDNTLFLARNQQVEPSDILDLVVLVESVTERLRKSNPSIAFNFNNRTKEQQMIRAGAQWLEVAFRHILQNAVKFGRYSPVDIEIVSAAKHDPARMVEVVIRDRGIGIPDKELQRIFEAGHRNPYSRKFVVTGAQAGLSIARQIIKQHHGEIWAKSQINEWSEFHVTLPTHQEGKA